MGAVSAAAAGEPSGQRPASAVDLLLAASRRRLERVGPAGANEVLAAGGLLVDIAPAAQRAGGGEIPGSIVIERNDLEWRLDPTSTTPPMVTRTGRCWWSARRATRRAWPRAA